MALLNVGSWQVGKAILRRRNFDTRTHSLSGTYNTAAPGRMQGETLTRYQRERNAGNVTYSVSSYATVVAYHLRGQGWVIPSDTYSQTTTRHMGIIRHALRGATLALPEATPVAAAPVVPIWPPVSDHMARVHGIQSA